MGKYQVARPLTPDERATLKADIAERGIMVDIEVDELGIPIDGHHRLEIAKELGITKIPKKVRYGFTEQQKFDHARKLNAARRHLNDADRRSLIEQQLRAAPQMSDRSVGAQLNVDHKTVGAVRQRLASSGEIPQQIKSTGSDGKQYPRSTKIAASKPALPPGIQPGTDIAPPRALPASVPLATTDPDAVIRRTIEAVDDQSSALLSLTSNLAVCISIEPVECDQLAMRLGTALTALRRLKDMLDERAEEHDGSRLQSKPRVIQ